MVPYRARVALLAALLSFALTPTATGQAAPPPFPEVNFRRIGVPGPDHTGPRITIQIAPAAAEADPVGRPADATDPSPNSDLDWFWSEISATLPADPSRFWAAQTLLSAAPEAASLSVPRLERLHAIAERHGVDILTATLGTEISPAFVLAVLAVESAGAPEAVSVAGAQGLMQLMPDTAERFGVTDPFDPAQNIAGGVQYLDWLMERFERDPILALAGYNAGEGSVARAGGVPEFDETRAYVPKVLATWSLARQLCRTPPEFISDGCVFASLSAN